MKKVFLFIALLDITISVQAQDIHFSQFDENPLLINPAFAGALYPLRASVSYRDQWRSVARAYRTMGVSADTRLTKGKKIRAGKFGLRTTKNTPGLAAGISIYRDKTGVGDYNSTAADLAVSCRVNTGARSFFSAAIQGNVTQKIFGGNDLIFPNQYDGTGYNYSIQHNETFLPQKLTYADLATGLLWCYVRDETSFLTDRELKVVLGASVYHIPERSPSFISSGMMFSPRRYVFHALVKSSMRSTRFSLSPAAIVQLQSPHAEFLGGLMFFYVTGNDTRYTGYMKRSNLGFGIYYRHQDAMIVRTQIEMNRTYAIGFSYDLNFSPLKTASRMRGGLEISLRYSPARGFLYSK